jgi:hypothetical protein
MLMLKCLLDSIDEAPYNHDVVSLRSIDAAIRDTLTLEREAQ